MARRTTQTPGEWIFNRMLQVFLGCLLIYETVNLSQDYPILVDALGSSKAMHARLLTSAIEMAMESLDCLGWYYSLRLNVNNHLQTIHLVQCSSNTAPVMRLWSVMSDFGRTFGIYSVTRFATTRSVGSCARIVWKRFRFVVLKCLKREETSVQAWRLLVLFIIKKLKQGHTSELDNLRPKKVLNGAMIADNATLLSSVNGSIHDKPS